MGLFDFVSDWKRKLIDDPLDARMTEMVKLGVRVAKEHAHVISGANRDSIGGTYNRGTKTAMLHADKPYSLIEASRGGAHDYFTPAVAAMAEYWGGSAFELHFPNAHVSSDVGRQTRQIHGITAYHRSMGRKLANRTRVIVRRHRRLAVTPTDPTTPIL